MTTTTWTGEHSLTENLLALVDRIDYATADEDAAQDMLCSLLQRMHGVKSQKDFNHAVKYSLMDAKRRRAQMTHTGVSWESLPDDGGHIDRRKEQLPSAIRPYDGPEPPVREMIPITTIKEGVILAKKIAGQYRFDRRCQVSAYVMPE